jgi:hypothetical protein
MEEILFDEEEREFFRYDALKAANTIRNHVALYKRLEPWTPQVWLRLADHCDSMGTRLDARSMGWAHEFIKDALGAASLGNHEALWEQIQSELLKQRTKSWKDITEVLDDSRIIMLISGDSLKKGAVIAIWHQLFSSPNEPPSISVRSVAMALAQDPSNDKELKVSTLREKIRPVFSALKEYEYLSQIDGSKQQWGFGPKAAG